MTARHSPLRKLTRAATAAAALLLGLVVLLDVTQAGRSYVYCSAMQEVMDHACCPQQRAPASTTTIASSQQCCHDRVVPALEAWASLQQTVAPATPWLAVIASVVIEPLAATGPRLPRAYALIRSGPPLVRVLARLMVFRL